MTLDALAGSATATSFVPVDDALLLLVGHPGEAAFSAAEVALQEAWLMQATQAITRRVAWKDVPANPLGLVPPLYQALPLPMVGQVDALGRPLPLDIVPPMAQEATALYALALAQQGGTVVGGGVAGIEEVKIGNITVTFDTTRQVVPALTLPLEVWDLLRPYGRVPVMGRHMAVVRGQG